jgi:hypothetical protein
VQLVPIPEKPTLQAQVKDPTVLVQEEYRSQLAAPDAHSFTSEQEIPSPKYPTLQEQEKDPTVFEQRADEAQL